MSTVVILRSTRLVRVEAHHTRAHVMGVWNTLRYNAKEIRHCEI